ncbi:hypothetical protein NM688_g2174 [Phlebia brevispora]|uniref:Uncharacterized protein n=1 Tax=Phlebia brevispora TaxID=194682 RepID=A0ACC1T911_9APHY|nr:hypothetical protein NM688_g2174 [Phlebia brevispora]
MDLSFHDVDLTEDADAMLPQLQPVYPRFFIPVLPDKPQDPIMESLHVWRKDQARSADTTTHYREDARPKIKIHDSESSNDEKYRNVWEQVLREPSKSLDMTLSWDVLRQPSCSMSKESEFLSERSLRTLSAVRHYVDPPFEDPSIQLIRALPEELFECLLLSLTGISSPLHVWDATSEIFMLRDIHSGKRGILLVDGMDEVISQSVLQRFLTIGTLIRRLENLAGDLRQSSVVHEASLHAFAHALSSVLHTIKYNVARLATPNTRDKSIADLHKLSTLCEDTEVILENLASLCGREMALRTIDYQPFVRDTSALLSAIYRKLEYHLDSHSPRTTTAVFAYLLTETSTDYFEQVCHSVGYGGWESSASEDFQNGSLHADRHSTPCFFLPESSRALIRARQSLQLLRKACPDHSLWGGQSRRMLRWIWTEKEILQAWRSPTILNETPLHPTSTAMVANLAGTWSGDGLQAFKLFDQEPGTHLAALGQISESLTDVGFDRFLHSFPPSLPSLTPSLSDLADLILSPLAEYVGTLSTSLLDVFYVRKRIFEHQFASVPSAIIHPAYIASVQVASNINSPARMSRVIGLAPGLTEGDWPPAGADLRLQLRTVIIDALDIDHPGRQLSTQASGADGQAQAYEEAEWRLGFAIRDLPTGSGHAKWLNPRSIEALDFLYIDYQPPSPLDVLITPSTLSKYHRLFAFNLRLLRVENVVNALFRMASRSSTPPFPTFTSSQKLFLHFRFLASSFIQSMTTYVYDTAIGSNFDTFTEKLRRNVSQHDGTFPDVFAVADYHSMVMDDILSACLLRSSQKAVGDLLRSLLDIILEFGILIGDRQRDVLPEYAAVGPLEELFEKYNKRFKTFMTTLKGVIEKGSMSSHVSLEDALLHFTGDTALLPQLSGVEAKLHNLVATTTTALTREVVDMMQILPAKAAASILLMIFDTVEAVQSNRTECARLAHRCFRLLSDVRIQIESHGWKAASPSMKQSFEKLEQTLNSIHAFMQREAESKWHSRLLRKQSIERDIADFTAQLDDAARSFEISTLISIHHAIGESANVQYSKTIREDMPPPPYPIESLEETKHRGNSSCLEVPDGEDGAIVPNLQITDRCGSIETANPLHISATLPIFLASNSASDEIGTRVNEGHSDQEEDESFEIIAHSDLNLDGGRAESESVTTSSLRTVHDATSDPRIQVPRYHQSQVRILSRSGLKGGWWDGCVQADLEGQMVMVKRYEGGMRRFQEEALRNQRQTQDVKILSRLKWAYHDEYSSSIQLKTFYSHRCLPKLSGNMLTLQGAIKGKLKLVGVEGSVRFILRVFLDIVDACLYLQEHLQLSKSQMQYYIERHLYIRISNDGRVYVAPPPSETLPAASTSPHPLVSSIRQVVQQALHKSGPGAAKDASLHQQMAHISASVASRLAEVTDDDPHPKWLLRLAESSHAA